LRVTSQKCKSFRRRMVVNNGSMPVLFLMRVYAWLVLLKERQEG
jgi:hypothetical protein